MKRILLAVLLGVAQIVIAAPENARSIIARTLYAEARGESHEGRLAVASVIWLRGSGDATRMAQACISPRQFSCWNAGKLASGMGAAWLDCQAIATQMVTASFQPTLRADHYYAPRLCSPKWAKGKPYTTVGRHRFLMLGQHR